LLKTLTEKMLWAEKCVDEDRRFQPMPAESECKTKINIPCILGFNFVGFF